MAHRTFAKTGEVFAGDTSRHLASADFDGDGNVDLVVANALSHDAVVLPGDGSGGFVRGPRYLTGIAPFAVAVADLDGDGRLDIVVANESNVAHSEGLGSGKVLFGGPDGFEDGVDLPAGERPSAVVVAEIDGQSGADIAMTNWKSSTVSIFRNRGNRRFETQPPLTYDGGNPYGLAAGDFDGDGAVDLAVTDLERDAVVVLYGDGRGQFPRSARHRAGSGVRHVVAVDLNGDGRLDLVTANTSANSLTILLGTPEGTFLAAGAVQVGKGPRTVMAADVDGDGKPDLVVANMTESSVWVLFQDEHPQPCEPPQRR